MSSICYILRHGETSGIHHSSSLSGKGEKETRKLNQILLNKRTTRIYSSPQPRAIESVAKLKANGCPLTIDDRLRDFVAVSKKVENYRDLITKSLLNKNWSFDSGETIKQVEKRLFAFLVQTQKTYPVTENFLISTHGVCAALLLAAYSSDTAFTLWEKLKVPDLYCIDFEQRTIEHVRLETNPKKHED